MRKINNIHCVWLTLILLTLVTYSLSYLEASGRVIMLVLITAAFIKGVLIIREFMKLKGVSLLWRLIMYGWLTFVCGGIVLAFLMA